MSNELTTVEWRRNVLVPMASIKASNAAGYHIAEAINNVERGIGSKTFGNITLVIDDRGYYEISDGFHRAAEALFRQETHIFADIQIYDLPF